VHACLQKCSERPNPFTPNGDGINDFVQFTFPEIGIKNADIFIYNLVGPITKIYVGKGSSASIQARWYGTDDKGLAMPPGIYLYIIEIDEQIVCSGSLTLAR
jgi:gliding motility-associated-like protein